MRVLKLAVLISVWLTSVPMARIVVGVLPDYGLRAESSMGTAPIPPMVGLLGSR
jgi:hypothetical protein